MYSYLVRWKDKDSSENIVRYFEYLSDVEKFVKKLQENEKVQDIHVTEVY